MKRIWPMMLALAAMCALSGAVASTAMAERCMRVEEPGTGNYKDAQCKEKAVGSQFIQATPVTDLGQHQWCAEVEEKGTGNFNDAQCTKGMTGGQFIKVWAQGPFWRVNGSQLKQGTKQVKFQAKGPTTLTGEVKGLASVEISCNNSYSEGATIEGQGSFQGQDKGRVIFEQCKTTFKPEEACKVVEPIKTTQLKSYLAYIPNNTQQKFGVVFEPQPQQKEVPFVTLNFTGAGCIVASAEVTGSLAGEVIPVEKESQELLLNFPKAAITTVVHEQVVKTVGLQFAGSPAVFSGALGGRLQTNEPWGVF
jgi:hypothetical protein